MIEFNTIYNEDCLETMKRMPDKSVDAIVTSPPYNLRLNSNGTGYKERGKTSAYSGKYDSFSDALPMNEYRDYHSQIINEMCRVSKVVFWNIQIVTGNKDAVFQILGSHFAQVRDVVVWDKGHGQPAMNEGMLNRGYELVIVFEDNAKTGRKFENYRFGRGMMPDVWRLGRGGNGRIRSHTAVFPIELPKLAIQNWTDRGGVVYDPFMGTGTTALAAKQLDRRYIGSEISKEYCEIAKKRIEEDNQ